MHLNKLEMAKQDEQADSLSLSLIFKRALRSGFSGMSAMAIQVASLMWMNTTLNYTYRHGGKIKDNVRALYAEGGIRRFYRGLAAALIQAPISRFGDTFSNTLFIQLLNRYDSTKDLPIMVKTLGASLTSATFRSLLTPIDTLKTILQVEGKAGLVILKYKVAQNGPKVLYHGSLAISAGTFVGHYPWFVTYNYLNSKIPEYENNIHKFGRQALIGFCSSLVSDCISNSFRVVKTTKQTYSKVISYSDVVDEIVTKDGVTGLLGRGLRMRILIHGAQGLMFSVLWRMFDDFYGREKQ